MKFGQLPMGVIVLAYAYLALVVVANVFAAFEH
jgi:hypothetical protein